MPHGAILKFLTDNQAMGSQVHTRVLRSRPQSHSPVHARQVLYQRTPSCLTLYFSYFRTDGLALYSSALTHPKRQLLPRMPHPLDFKLNVPL